MLLNEFNAINNTYNKIELSIKMKYALLFIFINLVNLVFNVKQGAKCPQERSEICPEIYQPVCGWFDPRRIQCFRYPCAGNYGNFCEACRDDIVMSVTKGRCPHWNFNLE